MQVVDWRNAERAGLAAGAEIGGAEPVREGDRGIERVAEFTGDL